VYLFVNDIGKNEFGDKVWSIYVNFSLPGCVDDGLIVSMSTLDQQYKVFDFKVFDLV